MHKLITCNIIYIKIMYIHTFIHSYIHEASHKFILLFYFFIAPRTNAHAGCVERIEFNIWMLNLIL